MQVASSKKSKMADTEMANGAGSHVAIDEDLHSRQLAVYGRESMTRMAASSILISGLSGLGVEVAKNAILAGVKSITLHDTRATTLRDLGSQFYLHPEDVGQNRAEACREAVQELNTSVPVSTATGPLDEDLLAQHQVVVLVDAPLREALRVDAFCHARDIAFVRAGVRGVFASVFCDFGRGFTVLDTDGEDPHSGIVASVTPGPVTLVSAVEDERLEFEEGEYVVFSEVVGMDELNALPPVKVLRCRAHEMELELDSSGFKAYERGGIVVQHKMSKTLDFDTLEQSLQSPGEFLMSDFSKLDRSAQLHAGFRALDAFEAAQGRLPALGSASDAAELVRLARELVPSSAEGGPEFELDVAVVEALARTAQASLSPMAAMLGGVVGQEVVKAATRKFHPLHQWFYFDCMECLPEEPVSEAEAARATKEAGRYADQQAVFGAALQRRLQELNVFVVGAGALGCELLKNLALMGVAVDEAGLVTVTDDDTIERSNLSRQFLFRDWDIGSAKSAVAAAAATVINRSLKIRALQNRVSPDSEAVFDDAFWRRCDVVLNALDNVPARLYVDARCVYYGRPLLESGTLGPKVNTQAVVPRMTENYGASRDPPEKQAPMCTLHSFPHNISHCLTYARSEFEGQLERT
ncbi:ThiF family protein, partial [Helicosporidium sp. ATCC 50920]